MHVTSKNIKVMIANKIPENLQAVGDWRMFEFVFFNILQNAIKYNNNNGRVVVSLEIGTWDQANSEGRQFVRVEVIDTGIGIDITRQHLLFKPFLELK